MSLYVSNEHYMLERISMEYKTVFVLNIANGQIF